MLAASAPGSPIESYSRQVETSDKLTSEMQAVSARVNNLLARLDNTAAQIDGLSQTIVQTRSVQAGITVQTQPATVAAIEKLERLSSENLSAVAAMKKEVTELKTDMHTVRTGQHGALWTFLVGLAALGGIITIVVLAYQRFQE
jgi:hypothetical protein